MYTEEEEEEEEEEEDEEEEMHGRASACSHQPPCLGKQLQLDEAFESAVGFVVRVVVDLPLAPRAAPYSEPYYTRSLTCTAEYTSWAQLRATKWG